MENETLVYVVRREVKPEDWDGTSMPKEFRSKTTTSLYEGFVLNGSFEAKLYTAFTGEPIEALADVLNRNRTEFVTANGTKLKAITNSPEHRERFPKHAEKDLGTRLNVGKNELEQFQRLLEEISQGTYKPQGYHK